MVYIKKEFTYVGIDETGIPGSGQNLILVMAQTSNPELATECSFGTFKKAADYIKEGKICSENSSGLGLKVEFPSLYEMRDKGLTGFHWMRSNNGRFSRQLLEYLSIAHIITQKYTDLSKVVLLIDSFHNKPSIGREILYDCIKIKGNIIPKRNIILGQGADRSIEIVNFADLIAYQICLRINNQYSRFNGDYLSMGKAEHEIPFDEERLSESLTETERNRLEKIIERLTPRSLPRKKKRR